MPKTGKFIKYIFLLVYYFSCYIGLDSSFGGKMIDIKKSDIWHFPYRGEGIGGPSLAGSEISKKAQRI